ncbi:hypothetical protein ILUMI_10127 [Ignelater luminosus]|uniref:Coiled-coil domain-containing protein 39 n=1 Tax=Ignelater luminosus TaxID=2038154 RepID=A0A8K0CYN8_IGNLU|nr:hypothetical protein ILUMI_10127 [Ignelater luminosus]
MDPSIEEILKRMGWTTGLHIPVANNENKTLQYEIEKLMVRKAKATQSYESEESRFNAMTNHLKFVKQQNLENQNLLSTYREHLDTQEHKLLLVQSEKDRVEQEMRQMQKHKQDVETRITNKKEDLNRGITRMEKIKSETSWDNEALKAWEESLHKRDEDNELLKKFSQEDERKAKELEAKRQNMQVEVTNRKQTLAKLIGDLTNYEQILERTGKVFKQQRDERTSLLKQWQEAIKNLKCRDDAVAQVVKDISMVQQLVTEEQEKLDEQNNFLNNEVNNNKEMDQQIQELNFSGSKLRRELNELVQYVLTINSEAGTLKRTLVSTANFLEKERVRGRNLTKDIEFKQNQVKQTEMELVTLQKKLDDVKNSSMSAADRANQLEKIIENEQRQTKVLNTDIERMQGVLFRTEQTFNDYKNTCKLKEMEINSCETATNLLKKHIKKLYDNLQKQKEINYALDFKINELQTKLDRLEGETFDENKQILEEKLIELEKALADENEVKQMLQSQVQNIEDEMRRLTTAIQSDNAQLESLQDKLQNEVLSFEGGMKQTTTAKQRSQQRQVDENILRLRVNQLENIMKREDYNIYTMQKFRVELELAMRERQIEINTHKEILLAKKRNLNEEKGRLKRDIGARLTKIDQLQKRFHLAIMALGKDDDGQPLSVTHFKIKNAQEKYMLQQEGDELDAKVKTAEKEIVAMENTLKVVNTANVTYRQSLSAVEEFDQEANEMRILENEISNITATVRVRKKELANKKNQIKELRHSLGELEEKQAEIKQTTYKLDEEIDDLKRYAVEQRVKIDRADRHLHMCMKNLDPRVTEKYHKNLVIRQLQDANKSALQQLAESATRYQEMTPHITRYIYDYNLQLPGPRIQFTPTSSSSDSTRSSEYYASGPYVSSLFLTFDPTAQGGNRSSAKKSGKRSSKKQTKS